MHMGEGFGGTFVLPRCAMLALFALTATAAPASEPEIDADTGWLYEVSVGVLGHDVDGLWSGSRAEDGVDLNVELVTRRANVAFLSGTLRPYVGLTVNTRGDTSKLYSGFAWHYRTDSGWLFKLGLGLAVHDGERETLRSDEKQLGSQVLFHIPIEIGHDLGARHRISLYFDHVSNASLADENEGLDTLGIRYAYHF